MASPGHHRLGTGQATTLPPCPIRLLYILTICCIFVHKPPIFTAKYPHCRVRTTLHQSLQFLIVTPTTHLHSLIKKRQHVPLQSGTQREREGSKWRYYAVKNGLKVDDIYSSWHQAYPYFWDPATQHFFPGSICKGFN